jgi:hypothetical protein
MRTSNYCSLYTHTRAHPSATTTAFQADADDVGAGTIETPLAMTPLGAADGVAEAEELPDVADADGAEVLRLAMILAASLGETVVVLANELAAPEPMLMLELDELELDDEEPLPLLPFLRTRTEISSTSMSMKVSSGPATIALLCRSTTPPFKG